MAKKTKEKITKIPMPKNIPLTDEKGIKNALKSIENNNSRERILEQLEEWAIEVTKKPNDYEEELVYLAKKQIEDMRFLRKQIELSNIWGVFEFTYSVVNTYKKAEFNFKYELNAISGKKSRMGSAKGTEISAEMRKDKVEDDMADIKNLYDEFIKRKPNATNIEAAKHIEETGIIRKRLNGEDIPMTAGTIARKIRKIKQ